MEVSILPMSEEHLDNVVAIEQASFEFPWTRNCFQKELTNRYAYYLIACLQGKKEVIGYAGIWVLFGEAHITTLAVKSFYRRQGVASQLLIHLFKKAFFKGAHNIFLEVRCSNQEAKNLYQKLNFKAKGRRKNYYKNEDALVMVCDLGKLSLRRWMNQCRLKP